MALRLNRFFMLLLDNIGENSYIKVLGVNNLRLSVTERKIIRRCIQSFDPQARIYLFGSRVNDNARGGDIDLLIISDKINFVDKIKLKVMIFKEIEEQKIDMLITRDSKKPFVKLAMHEGVQL
jgi:predicted nucleotidyltransferase